MTGSYEACVGSSPAYKDPISVVFVGEGTNNNVRIHAAHHDWGEDEDSGAQRAWGHGSCETQTIDRVQDVPAPDDERWHFRGFAPKTDPAWGTYTVTSPHYDKAVGIGDLPGCIDTPQGHYVPESWNGTSQSGYTAGAWQLVTNFIFGDPGHVAMAREQWYNTDYVYQCNGQAPQSDGYVWYMLIGNFPNVGGTGAIFVAEQAEMGARWNWVVSGASACIVILLLASFFLRTRATWNAN